MFVFVNRIIIKMHISEGVHICLLLLVLHSFPSLSLLLSESVPCRLVKTVVLPFSYPVSLLFVIFTTPWAGHCCISLLASECPRAQCAAKDRAEPYRPPLAIRDRNLLLASNMERKEDWMLPCWWITFAAIILPCLAANSLCGTVGFSDTVQLHTCACKVKHIANCHYDYNCSHSRFSTSVLNMVHIYTLND